ncbi:hypothetical protein GPALN_005394 [Globodera pallida]|nr:hypothetical protein GPALN_005394 [Globodera pallida]
MSATTTPNGTNSDGVPPAAYRIVFNVGGCKFETSRQTIRRIRGTRLTHLLDANEQSDGEEIFIDRDGTKFEYVLNFLRNGYILHVDDDGDELFDVLEKEAQFYGISEMANLCRSMREPLRHNEAVRWRKDAIPHYWRLFLKCLIDKTLHIPFTYERNSFFYAKCIACETDFDPKCSNVYSVNVDEWSALGHHMHQMCGRVEKVGFVLGAAITQLTHAVDRPELRSDQMGQWSGLFAAATLCPSFSAFSVRFSSHICRTRR